MEHFSDFSLRFRQAWKYNGHTLDELAFKSQATVWGSWVGLIFNILVIVVSFWTGFAPVGYADLSTSDLITSWFQSNLSIPILLVMYFGFKLVRKTKIKKISEIDVISGRREMDDLPRILAEERAIQAKWPIWKKVYRTVC